MPVLFWDLESRSTLNLAKVGAWRYAGDEHTDVLCVAYAIDDGPMQIWTLGQPIPEEFLAAVRDPDWQVIAHNAIFEANIAARILGPRYGWPTIPIERARCTMAAALASALPGSLDSAAAALGLDVRKDADGHRLMLQMSKPRKPRKDEDPNVLHWHDGPELRRRLEAYCMRDVEVERELYKRVPPLSDAEQELWALDATINRRGFSVDIALATAARHLTRETLAAVNAELVAVTDGRITGVNQVARLKTLLEERGHNVKGLGRRSVSAVLAHEPDADVARLLQLRQEGSRASANKLDTLLGMADSGRLHDTMRFHGAATGRWSGRGFQPHNLKRPEIKDLDAAIDAILAGDLERVRALGPPLSIIGDVSRSMIRAAPGHMLIGADYSSIESRVLAWLAGEQWKLDVYRRFDATGDPAIEPYCVTASRIFGRPVTPEDEELRQIGKFCELAFGFGGALGAFKRIAPDADFTDAEIETFKRQWRTAHPAICKYWRGLHGALRRALKTNPAVAFKNLIAERRSGNLYLKLPSGRELVYPEARLEPGMYDDEIVFMDNALGKWRNGRGWFGTFVENVVQAIARDLLAAAMPKVEAAGYPIVLHVHDEIVAEVPEDFGSVEEFERLMTALPVWAGGLPLVAKGSRRLRYAKSKTAAATESIEESLPLEDVDDGASCDWPGGPAPEPAMAEAHSDMLSNAESTLHLPASCAPPILNASPPASVNGQDVALPIEETLEERLARIPLPDLVGDSGLVNCPLHDDNTPSCYIYEDHYHCFGCGAHGNHLDWLRNAEGLSDDDAIEVLFAWQGPSAAPRREAGAERKREFALQLWKEAKPIFGTPAIDYLGKVRGIDVDALPTDSEALRFHPNCPFGRGTYVPCLLALFRDVITDEPVGIHRIGLTPNVFRDGKAKVQRRMLGPWAGPRAIKLWPASDRLFIGEGIETVLAAATRLSHNGAPMRPAWAAGSADGLGKIPFMPGIALTLLIDHDRDGHSATCAGQCRQRWRDAGHNVARLMPTQPGTDFNDIVLDKLRAAA